MNVGVLTEGFDAPDVGCIVLARPTKSFSLYRQMIGRGLRPADGKSHCVVVDHSGCTAMHGFVEEEVNWSLDVTSRAESRSTSKARANGQARELATCPECGASHWRGRPCGACGWRPRPKAEAVDVADADLVELKRDGSRVQQDLDRRTFYRQLIALAAERGYRPGWAAVKFKEKFGAWPSWGWRDDSPVEPVPATRSWVRSRMIAFARARAKAGAEA